MMLKEADGDDGRLMRRSMNRKGMQRVIMVTMSTPSEERNEQVLSNEQISSFSRCCEVQSSMR